MKREETVQNYLEAIYILSIKNKDVRAIDVVDYMGFSRPTVSIALKQLENDGYIEFDKYYIRLNETGLEIAKAMYERHEYIARLLISLGVNKDTAYEDSCMIEHDISEETFNAIKNATKDLFNV